MSSINPQVISQVRTLQRQAASLLLYRGVLDGDLGQAFLNLLTALQHETNGLECLNAYGVWFTVQAQAQQSWQEYLVTQILTADNPFTQQSQHTEFDRLSLALIAAAQSDLIQLQSLYCCSGEQLSQWVQMIAPLAEAPVVWQTTPSHAESMPIQHQLTALETWADAIELLTNYYRQFGTGLFARTIAFRWHQGELIQILYPDPVCLNQLVGYESQRDLLVKNTEFLLAGYPAQNVLLYGSRGSGKSSLIKALLHQYRDRGLRLIEVSKSDLEDLPVVLEKLRGLPQKFIIFVDDLSFEEDDDVFKALKVVLEGNVTARPQNVVVYATSNRRHLVREFFEDRPRPKDQDEIHAWDTVQEKLSFSDRFGLTLTFEPADQTTYLKIVDHLAVQAGLEFLPEDLKFQALQWATRHNGRSGRTARQFVDFLAAEQGCETKSDLRL
ncbi:MAG: ATP-binding protein [Microcoleaceae cyanobacterium]